MRRIIVLLIFLAASIWLGLLIVHHPGHVFIVTKPVMVQMPLWFAGAVILLVLAIFYLLIASVETLQFWWFRLKSWMRLRREKQCYSKTQFGLALLIEGRFPKAERLLLQGADQGEPLMNYLGAARAAQEQGALDRRNKYLAKAQKIAPHAELAIGLTQAELEMDLKQYAHARDILQRLRAISKRHPTVLRQLEKVYVHLQDWDQLGLLLPDLRKAKVITDEQYNLFEKNIACERLTAAGIKNKGELKKVWNSLYRAQRKNPEIVTEYVKQLVTFGDQSEAEELIRYTLKYNWVPELAEIYARFNFDNINRQLVIVGAWLKMYGPQPVLLLFLGKACTSIQLWGKAKDYFELCLETEPNPEAALEYGKLLESLGQKDEAVQQYKQVLEQLRVTLPTKA